jgi:hypothetical protein
MMAGEINKRLQQLNALLTSAKLTDVAYKEFYGRTPIRTGNARSKTKKQNNEIEANYPYATRLDNGYSSQAPRGMTQPTIDAVKEYIRKQSNGN